MKPIYRADVGKGKEIIFYRTREHRIVISFLSAHAPRGQMEVTEGQGEEIVKFLKKAAKNDFLDLRLMSVKGEL